VKVRSTREAVLHNAQSRPFPREARAGLRPVRRQQHVCAHGSAHKRALHRKRPTRTPIAPSRNMGTLPSAATVVIIRARRNTLVRPLHMDRPRELHVRQLAEERSDSAPMNLLNHRFPVYVVAVLAAGFVLALDGGLSGRSSRHRKFRALRCRRFSTPFANDTSRGGIDEDPIRVPRRPRSRRRESPFRRRRTWQVKGGPASCWVCREGVTRDVRHLPGHGPNKPSCIGHNAVSPQWST